MIWIVLALWCLGFVLLRRIPVCHKYSSVCSLPTVSLIIPARNEARNIQNLMTAIRRSSLAPLETIVVDDGSTDATASLAADAGATVLTAPTLPEGWRGKTWACQQGAQAARGEYLLFMDADVVLEPAGLERALSTMQREQADALSVGPDLEVEAPYEHLSAIFNLLTFMGIGAFAAYHRPSEPKGLFGPFLLIDRAVYWRAGGHEAVKGEILENLCLAEHIRNGSGRMRCFGGRGVARSRMYPDGPKSLVEGWAKAFATGAGRAGPLTLSLVVAWITGGMFAALLLLISPFTPLLAPAMLIAYLLYAVQIGFFLRQIGRFSPLAAAVYPLLLLAFFAIFGRSFYLKATGSAVAWRGRSIPAAPRPRA